MSMAKNLDKLENVVFYYNTLTNKIINNSIYRKNKYIKCYTTANPKLKLTRWLMKPGDSMPHSQELLIIPILTQTSHLPPRASFTSIC